MLEIKHLKIIATLLTILLFVPASAADEKRDSLVVSLLTCWPGAEVYELCGHSAVRIRTAESDAGLPLDMVWNYGIFDFNQPNFVYRFVKGDTDYMLGMAPTELFLEEYRHRGRKVLEQELNLTQEESNMLLKRLLEESKPENRVYRYNYVRDNCATRITGRLEEATGDSIVFPEKVDYGTLRNEMRAFHKDYPWYQLGIDLALGSGLDYKVRPNEEMFVPVVMSERYGLAHFRDGRPLVRANRELAPDSGEATSGPTPWYATPLFWFSVTFLIVIGLCILMARKRRIFKPVYAIWYGVLGAAGCVISFLVFVSTHAATDPNALIFWLNPLQLLFAAGMWSRKTRWMSTGTAWYNIVAVGILLLTWPFQNQSTNPALFPLMGATFALAITYAILAGKSSYNIRK